MQDSRNIALASEPIMSQNIDSPLSSMSMSRSVSRSGGTDIKGGHSAHRQAELEGKLIETLKHIWVIVHLDGDLV